MLGYMTAAKAKAAGFTHHASYYGIPVWMGDVDSEGPVVAAKWAPLDYLMELFCCVEGLLFQIVHGADAEPCFMFKLGKEIEG